MYYNINNLYYICVMKFKNKEKMKVFFNVPNDRVQETVTAIEGVLNRPLETNFEQGDFRTRFAVRVEDLREVDWMTQLGNEFE